MKKTLILLSIAAATLVVVAASCKKTPEIPPVDIAVQLYIDGNIFAVADVPVNISDEAHSFVLTEKTNANGKATFSIKPGTYTAEASYTAYHGTAKLLVIANQIDPSGAYMLELKKVEKQQIIIQELYSTGCPDNAGSGSTTNDAYMVLYNNSAEEADASNVVIGFLAPYNAYGTNKYYGTENKLIYEDANWIPSYGAIWWFKADEVKIPAYSKLVIAVFGAIDHTQTYSKSVNLANQAYYWMSNVGIDAYTNTKYAVSDVIPTSHYMTTYPFTKANAWAISNSCPAVFIGVMPKAQVEAISKDSGNYDTTLGTDDALKVVKFPKANVIGAVDIWSLANVAKSNPRFSADISTGYVALTNKKGYTVYRNVDKEATEALPENAGKLIYGYDGALDEAEGVTGEAAIDAEASIAKGAHIIYKQTNDCSKDYHVRKVSSLKYVPAE